MFLLKGGGEEELITFVALSTKQKEKEVTRKEHIICCESSW